MTVPLPILTLVTSSQSTVSTNSSKAPHGAFFSILFNIILIHISIWNLKEVFSMINIVLLASFTLEAVILLFIMHIHDTFK